MRYEYLIAAALRRSQDINFVAATAATGAQVFAPVVTLSSGTFTWDFGDGTTQASNSPSKTYSDGNTRHFVFASNFTKANVRTLYFTSDYVTNINVSQFTGMTELYCNSNPLLRSLNVSSNTALTRLTCDTCDLRELDISTLTGLRYLTCGYNAHLSDLDISNNIILYSVDIRYIPITVTILDKVISDLVDQGNSNGFLWYANYSYIKPSAAGYANLAILVSRGWTVTG